MNILIEKLGKVDAERFITLIIKEPFDYTQWQASHFKNNQTIRDFSKTAMHSISKL